MRIIELAMFVLVLNLSCFAVQASGAFPASTNTSEPFGYSSADYAAKTSNMTVAVSNPPNTLPSIPGTGHALQYFISAVINTPTALGSIIEIAIPNDPGTGLPTDVEIYIATAIVICCWVLYIAALVSLIVGYKVQD